MATPKSQRIIIWVIAAAMAIGSVGTYFLIVMQNQQAQTAQQQAAACTASAGETALDAPGVVIPKDRVTNLQSTDLKVGTGEPAKLDDCLVVKYYGTLAKDGTKFDENYTTDSGFAFVVGQHKVITGWDEGLIGMKAGGERRLVIPSSMAYGKTAQPGSPIPADSDLVFTVKLLRIQK